jgi:hypothetical protein
MIPKSGDRAGLDASGVATAEFSSGNARDTPLRVGSYRKMARECSFHTVCKIIAHQDSPLKNIPDRAKTARKAMAAMASRAAARVFRACV